MHHMFPPASEQEMRKSAGKKNDQNDWNRTENKLIAQTSGQMYFIMIIFTFHDDR